MFTKIQQVRPLIVIDRMQVERVHRVSSVFDAGFKGRQKRETEIGGGKLDD